MNRQEPHTAKSTYPKGGFSCFKDSFVVNHPLASGLRINICGENRHLRQARKR